MKSSEIIQDLNSFGKWLISNKLTLNIYKTIMLNKGSKSARFIINDEVIQRASVCKCLDVCYVGLQTIF